MKSYMKHCVRRASLGVQALMMALLALTAACSDNIAEDGLVPKVDQNIELTLDPVNNRDYYNETTGILQIGSEASTTTFKVTSNTRWTAEVTQCDGGWCSLSFPDGTPVVKDGDFVIQTTSNVKGSDQNSTKRECLVTVYAVNRNGQRVPDTGHTITIMQDMQTIGVSPSAFSSNFSSVGEVQNFTISANLPWRATVSDPDFLTLSLPADSPSTLTQTEGGIVFTPAGTADVDSHIIVTIQRNMTMATRRGLLIISSANNEFVPIRVEMSQTGTTESFSVLPTVTQTLPASGGEVTLTVLSPNAPWSITNMEGASASWLHLPVTSDQASDNPTRVTVTVDPNTSISAREATLFVQADGKDDTRHEVHIVQMGADQQLSVTTLNVENLDALEPAATAINFHVISTTSPCVVTSSAGWIVVGEKELPVGTRDVTVSVTANESNLNRTGTITFTAGAQSRTFTIVQKGRQIQIPLDTPSFSDPWIGGGWTQSSVQLYSLISFPEGTMPEYAKAGAVFWKGTGAEEGARTVSGELQAQPNAPGLYQLVADIMGLDSDTEYSAYAFVATPDTTYRATRKIVFKTPGRYPGEGDNNPPIIVER